MAANWIKSRVPITPGLDQEMNRELLLLTAKRVRELERQVAEIVRTIRERGPGGRAEGA